MEAVNNKVVSIDLVDANVYLIQLSLQHAEQSLLYCLINCDNIVYRTLN